MYVRFSIYLFASLRLKVTIMDGVAKNQKVFTIQAFVEIYPGTLIVHPSLEREDRLGKHPFAGFGTVIEDIKRTSYTIDQPIKLASQ